MIAYHFSKTDTLTKKNLLIPECEPEPDVKPMGGVWFALDQTSWHHAIKPQFSFRDDDPYKMDPDDFKFMYKAMINDDLLHHFRNIVPYKLRRHQVEKRPHYLETFRWNNYIESDNVRGIFFEGCDGRSSEDKFQVCIPSIVVFDRALIKSFIFEKEILQS